MISFKHEENRPKGKFIIAIEGSPAGEIIYKWRGDDKIIIQHTETYEDFGGQGIGKKLVNKVADFAREKFVKIVPLCPFAKSVMEKDENLKELIA